MLCVKNFSAFLFFILVFASFISGCAELNNNTELPEPPEFSAEELQKMPDTILIEGNYLMLYTFLYRDYMPQHPPNKNILGFIFITSLDSVKLPSNLTSDAVWLVKDNTVWKSFFSNEIIPPGVQNPYRLVKNIRNGPEWEPCMECLTVVVRVYDAAKHRYFLKASNQSIGSAY